MLAFVLRRLVQAVLVMLTVAFIAFMLFQYVGDPVTNILGQDATPQQREQLRADLGLDQPFPVQFARFVGNAVQRRVRPQPAPGAQGLVADRRAAARRRSSCRSLAALHRARFGIPMGVYAALQARHASSRRR